MTFRSDDDAAAINVFEAVVAAMLILSAVLYWNLLQQPSFDDPGAGDDYDRLADDVLGILMEDSAVAGSDIASWVAARLGGGDDAGVTSEMEKLLPNGMAYALRLETAAGSIHLAPDGQGDRLPRAGGSASRLVAVLGATSAGDADVYPGQPWNGAAELLGVDLGLCTITDVTDPFLTKRPVDPERHGAGPDRADVWDAADIHVPAGIPYGTWMVTVELADDVPPELPVDWLLCDTAGTIPVEIGPPRGDGTPLATASAMPYIVQLVVWPGG